MPCGRIGTVGYQVARTRARSAAHDAGGAGAAAHAARDGGRRLPAPASWRRRRTRWRCAASTSCISRAAIFTNLTRDHLDFHRDMEALLRAPSAGCSSCCRPGRFGVVNLDDPRGAAFAAAAPRPVTYAIDAPADVRPGPLSFSLDGLAFEVADAARHAAAALAAGRAAERLQRPRRRRDGDGARPAVQRDRTGHRRARARARPLSARVRRRPTTSASSSTTPTPTTP